VRLEGCGHVPYIECAEPFFRELRAFLGDNNVAVLSRT
jgi:pimeloyl-ACP methyl ester carboxylesterase